MDPIEKLEQTYHFTYQEKRQLREAEDDLAMWGKGHIIQFIDEDAVSRESRGKQAKMIVEQVREGMLAERRAPTDYEDFHPRITLRPKIREAFASDAAIWGRCPCPTDGLETRCCNLKTLDAVQGCAFGCSYCAVQSFYHQGEIRFVDNLAQRLSDIDLSEDIWHIGTGQSSDSLLWGNDYGTLDALKILARRYPEKIIELKTKSARTDWISEDWPRNIIATWSLNAEVIQRKEEHLTATIPSRLKAARKAADKHILVGFHLHPMVWFKGYEEAYRELIRSIVGMFAPEEVILVSMGTLTFTKSVLKTLRGGRIPSRILDMDLVPFAGKFSYPWETKRKLFQNAYDAFPASWKNGRPFFYLCFEDPSLWEPTFGYGYPTNQAFETEMRESYLKTLHS
ncbi:MAG: spore photoproduct lyase family protein [Sphaerochaetaceae bacterium]